MSKRKGTPDGSAASSLSESVDDADVSASPQKFKAAVKPPTVKQLEAYKDLDAPLQKSGFSNSDEPAMYFHDFNASLVPLSGVLFRCRTPDDSIPMDEASARPYVRRVTNSFGSLEHANDSATSNHMKRFIPGSTFSPPWAFEKCAWRIVVSYSHRPKNCIC